MPASGPKRTSQSHRRCPPLSGAPWRVQDSLVFLTIFLSSHEDGKGLLLSTRQASLGGRRSAQGAILPAPFGQSHFGARFRLRPDPPRGVTTSGHIPRAKNTR